MTYLIDDKISRYCTYFLLFITVALVIRNGKVLIFRDCSHVKYMDIISFFFIEFLTKVREHGSIILIIVKSVRRS
jgi:hypothetical protein